jgi:hypothetical protein
MTSTFQWPSLYQLMSLPAGTQPAYLLVRNRRARRPPVTIPAKNAVPKTLTNSSESICFHRLALPAPPLDEATNAPPILRKSISGAEDASKVRASILRAASIGPRLTASLHRGFCKCEPDLQARSTELEQVRSSALLLNRDFRSNKEFSYPLQPGSESHPQCR